MKKIIFAVVTPLEEGFRPDQLKNLIKSNENNHENLFPFSVDDNNSTCTGLIPNSVMSLSDFHEEDFYCFMKEMMNQDFSGKSFISKNYTDSIEVILSW